MCTRRPKQQKYRSEFDLQGGRAQGGKARRSLARWTHQQVFVASRVSPIPPVVPSNGRALEVGRRGPTAIGD
jgi:hypothetical protein